MQKGTNKINHKIPESDQELLKRTGLAVVDAVVATVDASLAANGAPPLTTGAWALSKALLGNGIALRQRKALEWVEMIRDNPSIFTKEIVSTEEFQDAFVTSLEGYIKERNADKRILLREIFKDYASSEAPEAYPLERFNEITKQITLFDAETFSYLYYLSTEQQPGRSFQDTRHSPGRIESVLHLISLGLLFNDDRPRALRERPGIDHPYVFVSGLGSHYYKFIEAAESAGEEVKG